MNRRLAAYAAIACQAGFLFWILAEIKPYDASSDWMHNGANVIDLSFLIAPFTLLFGLFAPLSPKRTMAVVASVFHIGVAAGLLVSHLTNTLPPHVRAPEHYVYAYIGALMVMAALFLMATPRGRRQDEPAEPSGREGDARPAIARR